MRDHSFQSRAWLLCLPLLVGTPPALAQDQLVDLQSSGGYTSYRLADDVTQVDLVEQTQGACRFNRTWGYDLTNRELWTNGGCGGRFKITRTYASGNNSGSNAGAAVAAVAAIAGIALLANHNRHDDDRRPEYPGYPGQGGDWGREIRVDGRLCLDVRGGKFQPGTTLQVYECNGTASQRFAVGRGGEIRVRDLCVDVDRGDPRDGARVVLWSCSGSRSQSWFTRGGQIVSQLTSKCLDVDAGQILPGAHTMVWPCNRSPSQRWWW
ncbi:lectin [Acidovorax sp. ST3]|uniref:lectin n=1 Tax=Acidovorax sp. ST3 TaxID=2219062 RepID=UPI000DA64F2F|nr:lectin [Acidovorax sp. ST3]